MKLAFCAASGATDLSAAPSIRPELRRQRAGPGTKTTVEAYLRHEGGERLSVLGKLAPSRFARSLTS